MRVCTQIACDRKCHGHLYGAKTRQDKNLNYELTDRAE